MALFPYLIKYDFVNAYGRFGGTHPHIRNFSDVHQSRYRNFTLVIGTLAIRFREGGIDSRLDLGVLAIKEFSATARK